MTSFVLLALTPLVTSAYAVFVWFRVPKCRVLVSLVLMSTLSILFIFVGGVTAILRMLHDVYGIEFLSNPFELMIVERYIGVSLGFVHFFLVVILMWQAGPDVVMKPGGDDDGVTRHRGREH